MFGSISSSKIASRTKAIKQVKEVLPLDSKLYPNPTTDKLFLNHHSEINQLGVFRLLDINGREVLRQKTKLVKGNNVLDFSIKDLVEGIYIFKGEMGSNKITKKVIIK